MSSRDTTSRGIASGIVTGLVLLFLFVPLVVVVLFSFHKTASLSLPFRGFSTQWYTEVFDSPEFRNAIRNSLLLAIFTAAACTVLGTLAAYALARTRSRLKGPLTVLFFLPITLPPLFVGIALLTGMSRIGIAPSIYTIAIAHVVVAFPFFFLIARVALERIDPMLEEAATDLGASPARAFFKVTLPQVRPILIGAAALAFMVSLDEFVVTFFVSGSETTLPLYIFSRLRQTLDPSINVVSTLLMLSTLVLWLLAFVIALRTERRRTKLSTAEGLS